MKRFQDSNWLIKLWRLRHYVYIPFRFIGWKFKDPGIIHYKDRWKILVGAAQCDMRWYYTSEEVMERLNQNGDE